MNVMETGCKYDRESEVFDVCFAKVGGGVESPFDLFGQNESPIW